MNHIRKIDRKLIKAVENNSFTLVRGYLSKGANIAFRNYCAFKICVENNNIEMFKILFQYYPQIVQIKQNSLHEKYDSHYFDLACNSQYYKMCQCLISKGFNVSENMNTNIINLVQEKNYQTIEMLILRNFDFNPYLHLIGSDDRDFILSKKATFEKNKYEKNPQLIQRKIEIL